MNNKIIGRGLTALEVVGTLADCAMEHAQIFLEHVLRIQIRTALFPNSIGTSFHLEDGGFPVQGQDVSEQSFMNRLAVLGRKAFKENLGHHFRPAVPEPGERAIEIEYDVADLWPGGQTGRGLDLGLQHAGKAKLYQLFQLGILA